MRIFLFAYSQPPDIEKIFTIGNMPNITDSNKQVADFSPETLSEPK